jgi:biopolymer transport protein ExbD
MICHPLELQSRLSPPPRDLDFFAWVNVGVIAVFFSLLGSRFVLPSGTAIDVGGPNDATIELPQGGSIAENAGVASVVVSYRRDNVILFEGGMYSLPELRSSMAAYARLHPGAVMLVRADRQVSMQAFLELCEMAKEVGFANVLVAGEQATPGGPKEN